MQSRTTKRFRVAFDNLPENMKKSARVTFKKWIQNPYHRSFRFKQIHSNKPIYSVRIGRGWRALGVRHNDIVIWFWIGSHSDYDKLIKKL